MWNHLLNMPNPMTRLTPAGNLIQIVPELDWGSEYQERPGPPLSPDLPISRLDQLFPRGSPRCPPWPSLVPSGRTMESSVPPRVPSRNGLISTATLSPGLTTVGDQPMRACWPVDANSIDHCFT